MPLPLIIDIVYGKAEHVALPVVKTTGHTVPYYLVVPDKTGCLWSRGVPPELLLRTQPDVKVPLFINVARGPTSYHVALKPDIALACVGNVNDCRGAVVNIWPYQHTARFINGNCSKHLGIFCVCVVAQVRIDTAAIHDCFHNVCDDIAACAHVYIHLNGVLHGSPCSH